MTSSQLPACPTCGGQMFDERKSKYWNGGKTKEGKKKPMFKCRDKDNCDGVLWAEPGNEEEPEKQGTVPPLPPITFEELCKRYGECMGAVVHKCVPYLENKKIPVTGELIVSMTGDLFAERNRRGV